MLKQIYNCRLILENGMTAVLDRRRIGDAEVTLFGKKSREAQQQESLGNSALITPTDYGHISIRKYRHFVTTTITDLPMRVVCAGTLASDRRHEKTAVRRSLPLAAPLMI
ncbi:hypothetical protein EVAR_816_1 [Eumeta japonica]|uniref:Uncharacterized protein n=1 Tax=Eumeta variegata TaxID=151549 RepID=A0A4C1SCB5_EUMVA|nr:hypothetical protein EVAR_816_1 [Eumeta japonica]